MRLLLVIFLFATLGVAGLVGYRATEPDKKPRPVQPFNPPTLDKDWGQP